ncbi:MAG TPA: S24 family peptidase [Gemmatimonadales bacterium]|nr:S24 family peptidase [Gemmatimonadales bacterium]
MRQDREVRGFRAAELDESVLEALGALAADIGPGAPGDEHDEYLRWRAAELRRGRAAGVLSWSDMKSLQVARRAFSSAVAIRARLRVESGMPESVQPRMGFRGVVALPREALQAAASEGCAPWLDLGVAAGVGRELWDEPCEQWVRLPDDLPRGRFVALTVAGDSMEPLLHQGDVVLTEIGAPIRRDAIVVARRVDDGYVVKRVGEVAEREVELLSLNPEYPPMRIPREAGSVVGTVVMRWCSHEQ